MSPSKSEQSIGKLTSAKFHVQTMGSIWTSRYGPACPTSRFNLAFVEMLTSISRSAEMVQVVDVSIRPLSRSPPANRLIGLFASLILTLAVAETSIASGTGAIWTLSIVKPTWMFETLYS